MLQRCTNPKNAGWHRYGGRGIVVCRRWRKFENFYKDMGPRPKGMTLERIDNNSGYRKGNCKWASTMDQYLNKKRDRDMEGKFRL